MDAHRPADAAGERQSGSVRGRCAEFCAVPGPTVDAAVELHGRWCVSRPVAREVVGEHDGGPVEITVDLVSAFGSPGTEPGEPRRYVRIAVDPDLAGDPVVRLDPGAARTLAAALTVAAAQCEQLDLDLASAGRARYLAQVPRA